MSCSRRKIALAGLALPICLITASLPAQASDAAEASSLVQKSQAVLGDFVGNNEFPTLRPGLAKARAVLIFPQVLKAGFILGGSGGTGVLLVHDAATGDWSGPAFYTMGSASLGFQAGASAAEVVILVNSQKALDSLYSNKLKLGGDASVAVGPKGAGTGASLTADFIAYSTVKGAFAGLAIDGSVLDVRQSLNQGYYGKPTTPVDILVKRDPNNPQAAPLRDVLKAAAK